MTLFKQIALLVSMMFLILLAVILANNLRSAAEFQQGQLQTTAQDMATTLGITISNLPEGEDAATLEVLFNAVFDSGYYSRIELHGVDGSLIHGKRREAEIEEVPGWFIDLVPLVPASGSTQVMRGWSQLGQLDLTVHPGFAYRSLYAGLVSTLRWFVLLFLVGMTLLWLVLRYILQPLQRVREQAEAIQANRFVQQEQVPSTVELRRVVEAMNLMVSKVKGIFDDQEQTLQNYQQLLYRDPLTNLGNRRYLLDQLKQGIADEAGIHGSMAIVRIAEFERLRERQGYEVSDNLLRILADLMRQAQGEFQADRLSRFNDDEFAFMSQQDESGVEELITALFSEFQQLIQREPDFADIYLVAGIARLDTDEGIGGILSAIDYSLSLADTQGPWSIEHQRSTGLQLPRGKMMWRAWLEDLLASDQLFLVGQLALGENAQPVQRELFVRARDENDQIVPASAFMPMAASLGMAIDIDKAVFRLIVNNQTVDRSVPLAINLSADFFELAEAQEEFDQLLFSAEQSNSRLCIEASHHVLVQHPVMCAKVAERVRRHGHEFGLDNLDLGLSLQLLQNAQFNYVKINAQALHDMMRDEHSAGYQAFKTMTDTMGIRIVAVGVDSEPLFDALRALGIKVLQGNFLDQPEPI